MKQNAAANRHRRQRQHQRRVRRLLVIFRLGWCTFLRSRSITETLSHPNRIAGDGSEKTSALERLKASRAESTAASGGGVAEGDSPTAKALTPLQRIRVPILGLGVAPSRLQFQWQHTDTWDV